VAETRPNAEWRVRVPMGFLDARRTPMSDQARVMLLILEGYARTDPDCFPGNGELAAMTGKKVRSVQLILDELEAGGWIARTYGDGSRPERKGIQLVRRVDPDLPTSGNHGGKNAQRVKNDMPEAQKKTRPERKKMHAQHVKNDTLGMQKIAPELGLTNKTQLTTTTEVELSSLDLGPEGGEDAVREAQAAFDGEADAIASQVRKAFAEGVRPEWIVPAITATRVKRKGWSYFLGVLGKYAEQGGPIGGVKAKTYQLPQIDPERERAEREAWIADAQRQKQEEQAIKANREAEFSARLEADRSLLASHGRAVPAGAFRVIGEASKLRAAMQREP
jgi:hypothetical protein